MRYALSIDFYNQGEITDIKEGDLITFVSLNGVLMSGKVDEIKLIGHTKVPKEYIVIYKGNKYIACADYVIRRGSKPLGLKTKIEVNDSGFPLRT
ncbi:hypothetical protein BPT24_064 [Tenacibaculum phage pT24]|uniref:Uncharacterized protein n=1 Tax=Tenacibaculum phage pT24 TaxID=1880590 RepID=A0A1B4XWL6_9CAUD|nr:hypothetical protein HYP10_gp064 [Tenacibaculum phage pT24]BAV39187.1 hypothetical protein BPT24_064 [Tenacibaculum phage pT24]